MKDRLIFSQLKERKIETGSGQIYGKSSVTNGGGVFTDDRNRMGGMEKDVICELNHLLMGQWSVCLLTITGGSSEDSFSFQKIGGDVNVKV